MVDPRLLIDAVVGTEYYVRIPENTELQLKTADLGYDRSRS